MTVDLVAFLRARLDEDERHVRHGIQVPAGGWLCVRCGGTLDTREGLAEHLFMYHGVREGEAAPARVLAEVDAKRRIIDAHQPETRTVLDGANMPSTHEFCDTCTEWIYPCETLRLLALPCADHPDYREEWRP